MYAGCNVTRGIRTSGIKPKSKSDKKKEAELSCKTENLLRVSPGKKVAGLENYYEKQLNAETYEEIKHS